MKEREIKDYPDALNDVLMSLVKNTELLSVFVAIIFKKTNAYDSKTLCTSMILVMKWINEIEYLGFQFPQNFDFTFFYKGVSVALEIDHS